MHQLLTEYLLHANKISLYGIGTLQLKTSDATYDVVSQQMHPPSKNWFLLNDESEEKNFIHYLKEERGLNFSDAENEFKTYCEKIAQDIRQKEEIVFHSIGALFLNGDNKIEFKSFNHSFLVPVNAERLVRQDAVHNILVGDEEKSSEQMNELLNNDETTKDRWWIAALVALLVGLSVLAFLFFNLKNGDDLFKNRQIIEAAKM